MTAVFFGVFRVPSAVTDRRYKFCMVEWGDRADPAWPWRQLPVDGLDIVIHICIILKTATVRDLRNRFPRVAAWIAEGEPVEITKGGKLFARLVPPAAGNAAKPAKPDIMAQLRQTWGDRFFSSAEVAEMRATELED